MTVHKHHSTCEQCVFYNRHNDREGACRRHAPQPYTGAARCAVAVTWPTVPAIDWCGDFEPMPQDWVA